MSIMNKEHIVALESLQEVIAELYNLCDRDQSFNELLFELNEKQNVFGRSLDEYNILKFIEDKKDEAGKEWVDGKFVFHGTQIENPFLSECMRFDVNPLEHYKLTKEELIKIIQGME